MLLAAVLGWLEREQRDVIRVPSRSLGDLVLTKFFTRRRYQALGNKITVD
jgi:hypothetical protein